MSNTNRGLKPEIEAKIKSCAQESANEVVSELAEQVEQLADAVSKQKSFGAPEAPVLTKSQAEEQVKQVLNKKMADIFSGDQLPMNVNLGKLGVKSIKDAERAEDEEKFGYNFKSLNTATGGVGLTIEEYLGPRVIERARESVKILSLIGHKSVPSVKYREMVLRGYPGVSDGVENVAGVEWPETDTQTYEEIVMQVGKQYAKPSLSQEAISDSSIDIMAMLERLLSEEMARYWALQVLFGNGATDKLRGILSSKRCDKVEGAKDSAVRSPEHFRVITSGKVGSLALDNKTSSILDKMIDMQTSLPTAYMSNAGWLMNRTSASTFRKMRIADPNATGEVVDNRPILNFVNGSFMLLDHVVHIEDYMPSIQDADNPATAVTTPIIFGDLSKAYCLVDIDTTYLVDPYSADGKVILKVTNRKGELVQNNDAITILMCDVA